MEKEPVNKQSFDAISKILALSIASTCFLLGIVLLIVSIEVITLPLLTSLILTRILAVMLLVAGIVRLIYVNRFRHRYKRSFLIVLFYFVIGILLLINPSLSSVIISFLLILSILFLGILEIILALRQRNSSRWYWLFLSGILTVTFSIVLWLNILTDIPELLVWFVKLSLLGLGLFMLVLTIYVSQGKKDLSSR
ncbi:MAG: DUF308 domain-containing protein [Crocosphaera sp.]